MSFRCQGCNLPQPPNTRPTKIVTKVRPKTYPERTYTAPSGKAIADRGGQGAEIEIELSLCPLCLGGKR